MAHIICYDITHNGLRQKIADKLLQYGLDRLQYSVFVGNPSDQLLLQLKEWLEMLQQSKFETKDTISLIKLGNQQLENMYTLGKATIDIAEVIGKKNTLIIDQ